MRRATSTRAHKLEEMIMHELGRILVEDVQDPRIEWLTISAVRLNRDLTIAEVLYTHSGADMKRETSAAALESAQGFFRSQLGTRLKLRRVPELRFKWDEYLEEMIHDAPRHDS
jgi:ribosome-binding factor A